MKVIGMNFEISRNEENEIEPCGCCKYPAPTRIHEDSEGRVRICEICSSTFLAMTRSTDI
jgi:hypothetical protein